MADLEPLRGTIELQDKFTPTLKDVGAAWDKFTGVVARDVATSIQGFQQLGASVGPLGGAAESVVSFGSKVTSALGAIGPLGIAAAAGAAAVAGGFGLLAAATVGIVSEIVSLAKGASDLGDELFSLSASTGITVERLSELKFIAAQTDVPLNSMTMAMLRLGGQVSAESPKIVRALGEINLTVGDLRKLNSEQAFTAIIKGLQAIPSTAKQSAVSFQIFGRQSREINKLLTEDMDGLAKEARDTGQVFSTEFAVAGDKFGDAMHVMSGAIDALKMKLGAEFLPVATAFVEVFTVQLVSALNIASASAAGYQLTIDMLTVKLGMWTAAGIAVLADFAQAWVDFNAVVTIVVADMLSNLGQSMVSLGTMMDWVPGISDASVAFAKQQGAAISNFAANVIADTAKGKIAVDAYVGAIRTAAVVTGVGLPGALARVNKEISSQAEVLRKAREAAGGFGIAMGGNAAAMVAAGKAADALNKEQDATLKSMQALGVMTDAVVANAITPLIAGLNEAARVSDTMLRAALIKQIPDWAKLMVAMKAAGMSVTWLQGLFEDFANKAGLPSAAAMMDFERGLLAAGPSVGQMVANMTQLNVVAIETAGLQDGVTKSFEAFGLKTPAQLQAVAKAAQDNYTVIVQSGQATKAQIEIAWDQMTAAQLAAQGKVPNAWKTEILPKIVGVVQQLSTAVQGSFAQMLLGAKSFKDGFIDIWKSIKASVARILTEIIGDFVNRFLKGLLGALAGQQGAFGKAFAGLLSGSGSSGGGFNFGSLFGAGAGAAGTGAAAGGLTGVSGAAGGVFAGGTGMTAGGLLLPGGTAAGGAAGGAGAGGASGAGGVAMGTVATGALLGAGAGMVVGGIVGGKTGSATAGGLSGAGAGALVGAIGGPIGMAIGAIVGGLYGWYSAKKANKGANDFRDQGMTAVASQLGGTGQSGTGAGSDFSIVAAQAAKAGATGLFEKFLQANTPAKVKTAFDQLTAALDAYAKKEGEAAAAIEKTKMEFEARAQVIKDQMKGLDDELAQLNASEAPEEVMGVIETQTRARIAAEKKILQAQLDDIQTAEKAALAAIDATGGAASAAVDDTVGKIEAGARDAGGYFTQMTQNAEYAFGRVGKVGTEEAERVRLAMLGIGRNIPPIVIPWKYQQQPGDEPPVGGGTGGPPVVIPGAAGGIYATGATATWFGEGGEPELGGPVSFMSRVLAQAQAQPGAQSGRITFIPVIVRGQVTDSDVDYLVQTLSRAEPMIAGNAHEVRTRLNTALRS